MKLLPDPDGESDRVRNRCVLCGQRCNTFCTGCKCALCLIPPQDRKVREMVKIEPSTVEAGKRSQSTKAVWKKVPSSFYVDVPKLDTDGNVQTTSNGPVYTRLYGEATCYHIAHRKKWQEHLLKQQAELVTQVGEATKKAEKAKKRKKKKRKSKKTKSD